MRMCHVRTDPVSCSAHWELESTVRMCGCEHAGPAPCGSGGRWGVRGLGLWKIGEEMDTVHEVLEARTLPITAISTVLSVAQWASQYTYQ